MRTQTYAAGILCDISSFMFSTAYLLLLYLWSILLAGRAHRGPHRAPLPVLVLRGCALFTFIAGFTVMIVQLVINNMPLTRKLVQLDDMLTYVLMVGQILVGFVFAFMGTFFMDVWC